MASPAIADPGPNARCVTIVVEAGRLNAALKALKAEFDYEIRAALRRHERFTPPGEARRSKRHRARLRQQRDLARQEREAAKRARRAAR